MNSTKNSIRLMTFMAAILGVFALGLSQAASEGADDPGGQIEKGPNNGRMLRDGEFAIELAIFEDDTPPEFRVFPTMNGHEITPEEVTTNVVLKRLGGIHDEISFFAEDNYLRGDMVIYEPHSFEVELSAKYQGKEYLWSYENFEGRVRIEDSIAKAMQISTEMVAPRQFDEKLEVYGKLTLPADASRNIRARFPGVIKSIHVTFGERVEKGQLLLSVEGNDSLQTYKIYSPIDGIITEQYVSTGEQALDQTLLVITNQAELIAELEVFPSDQTKVHIGDPVTILGLASDKQVTSEILDALLKVNRNQAKIFRAKIDNSSGLFAVGEFIKAHILIDSYQVVNAVKTTGLQGFRDFTVVYAKVGDQYEVRMLELGRVVEPWIEVLGGITTGTEYVSKNSYIIKADIEKSGASHDH